MEGLDPVTAVRLSLWVGLWSALLGFFPALAIGWLLSRRTFVGKSLLGTLVVAPLVIPPVVTGFILLRLFGRSGPLGGLLAEVGLSLPFRFPGAVLAALVVGFPLYVLSVRSAFDAVDQRYEQISWSLGVPPLRTFWRITLPLALPGIAAGAVLSFARALGEFGATVVIAGNREGETRTIPLAVYTLLESPAEDARVRTLVLASLGLSLVALLGYELLVSLLKRRLDSRDGI
jgi:molybdate transport system permease protein